MFRALHRISALTFYLLGGSYFLAYLLVRNDIGIPWTDWWMRIGDLPLALAAITFGGTGLYASLGSRGNAWWKAVLISLPLITFFGFLIALNFWNVWL